MSDVMHLFRGVSRPHYEAAAPSSLREAVMPGAEVWDTEAAYHLELDLPGVRADWLSVGLDNGLLTITAERSRRAGAQDAEHRISRYTRSFRLPKGVDVDAIDAELSDGVLHLTLPKQAQMRARTIEVRVGSSSANAAELTLDADAHDSAPEGEAKADESANAA